jgi:flagellar motor switch protein FliG
MNENDARVKAYMKAAGLIKTTDETSQKDDLSIKLPSNVRLEKNENANPEKDSIYRRVAKFLLLIGIDEAAKIIPHLSPEQTEKIIPEIASIRSVDPDEATVILAEFENLVQRSREDGGVTTAKAILVKAFGQERAEQMLEKSVPFHKGKPFEYMQEMEGERVFFLLKEESSAVQALVLSHLKPKVAADVINQMELNAKTEVVRRLATLKKIDPEILRRVDQAMQEKVKTSNTSKSDSIDGRGALADILKKMSPDSEKNILSMLSDTDPDLGIDLRQRLFTVDDVLNCDDRVMQEKLHQMSETEIAYLVAGKSQEFRDKIFKNISKGRGDIVLEEENLHKPMLKKDCETVTAEFFSYLRRKWEAGELRIIGRDDEQYV